MVGNCTSKPTGRVCRRKHHTLVHDTPQPYRTGEHNESPSVNTGDLPSTSRARSFITNNQLRTHEDTPSGIGPPVGNNYTHHTVDNIPYAGSQTLLPTILADVDDAWRSTTKCRMLLDKGSTITLASQSFAHGLLNFVLADVIASSANY